MSGEGIMKSVIDYFHAQPNDVQQVVLQAVEADRERALTIIREKLGDSYTEQQLSFLWTAAAWMLR
jgi:hypothetical protein